MEQKSSSDRLIDGDVVLRTELTDLLGGCIGEGRRLRMESVLAQRTRFLTVVLEDVYNSHNASAVIRSCEAFGIQDVHVIENQNRYKVNRKVTQGATRWLTLHRHRANKRDPVASAVAHLRDSGFALVGATPDAGDDIDTYPIDRPTAIVFGNEIDGLSSAMREALDGTFRIPLYGFSESLNLSVAAATVLRTLVARLRTESRPWELSEEEAADLRFAWYRRSVRDSDLLIRRHISERTDSLSAE